MSNRRRHVLMIAMFCAWVTPTVLFAQPVPLWTMATVEVKPDMALEFEELQKELKTAYEKAGMSQRLVFQIVRGSSSRYLISEPVQKFADLDHGGFMAKAMGEAGAAQWVARVTKCIRSRRVDTLESREDLSIPGDPDAEQGLIVWTSTTNLPGRYPDYNQWLAEKWVPAMKAAGMKGVFYFRNRFGGNRRQWYSAVRVDNWAVFDAEHPVRAHLGQEAYSELRAGVGAMTEAPVREIMRLRPDLSILQE